MVYNVIQVLCFFIDKLSGSSLYYWKEHWSLLLCYCYMSLPSHLFLPDIYLCANYIGCIYNYNCFIFLENWLLVLYNVLLFLLFQCWTLFCMIYIQYSIFTKLFCMIYIQPSLHSLGYCLHGKSFPFLHFQLCVFFKVSFLQKA